MQAHGAAAPAAALLLHSQQQQQEQAFLRHHYGAHLSEQDSVFLVCYIVLAVAFPSLQPTQAATPVCDSVIFICLGNLAVDDLLQSVRSSCTQSSTYHSTSCLASRSVTRLLGPLRCAPRLSGSPLLTLHCLTRTPVVLLAAPTRGGVWGWCSISACDDGVVPGSCHPCHGATEQVGSPTAPSPRRVSQAPTRPKLLPMLKHLVLAWASGCFPPSCSEAC